MGFEIPGFRLGTQVAADDLTGGRFGVIGTAGTIAAVESAGARADGVIVDAVEQGEAVTLGTSGVEKVVAGDAITDCGPVTSDDQGRAITISTEGHSINGIALETASAAGEVIAVLVGYQGVVPSGGD